LLLRGNFKHAQAVSTRSLFQQTFNERTMKQIQHRHKVDVFYNWVSANLSSQMGCATYWPQICYDWTTEVPLHIVFEKKDGVFVWPWNHLANLPWPYTDINFSSGVPTLVDGSPWDYRNWHKTALNGDLTTQCSRVPATFWDWRLQVKPKNNLTCDLDVLHRRNSDGVWVGVEATEIWFVDEDSNNLNCDCYQHVHNLIHLRKSFNFKALRAQNKFISALGGKHYLVLHQNNPDKASLVSSKVMTLELNMHMISLLENMTGSRLDVKRNLGQYFVLCDLKSLFL
jgi:hypothetical protein